MFGLAVSAGAQTPSTPQTPSPSTPSTPSPSSPTASPTNPYPSAQAPSADRAGKESKITGCVAAGTSASSFELTNVKKGPMAVIELVAEPLNTVRVGSQAPAAAKKEPKVTEAPVEETKAEAVEEPEAAEAVEAPAEETEAKKDNA